MPQKDFIAPSAWRDGFRKYPVVAGHFGPRIATFSTSLDVGNIRSLLGHDPRSRYWRLLDEGTRTLYESVQRKTDPKRMTRLEDFLRKRTRRGNAAGALPAISIAFPGFVSYTESEALPGCGVLEIADKSGNDPIVIDGLGRLSTLLDLYQRAMDDDRGQGKSGRELLALLNDIRIPVTLFAPRAAEERLSQSDLQQLFSDFNFKSVKISSAHAMALDSEDVYGLLARNVAEKSASISAAGGLDTGAPNQNRARGQAPFVKLKDLRLFAKAALEGGQWATKAQGAPDDPNADRARLEEQSASLAEFLDAVANAMGERFVESPTTGLLRTAKGWYTLGSLYHDLHYVKRVPDPLRLAGRIGHLNWSHAGPIWRQGPVPLIVNARAGSRAPYAWGAYTGYSAHEETARRVRVATGVAGWLADPEPGA